MKSIQIQNPNKKFEYIYLATSAKRLAQKKKKLRPMSRPPRTTPHITRKIVWDLICIVNKVHMRWREVKWSTSHLEIVLVESLVPVLVPIIQLLVQQHCPPTFQSMQIILCPWELSQNSLRTYPVFMCLCHILIQKARVDHLRFLKFGISHFTPLP